jgi:hypothetical protein
MPQHRRRRHARSFGKAADERKAAQGFEGLSPDCIRSACAYLLLRELASLATVCKTLRRVVSLKLQGSASVALLATRNVLDEPLPFLTSPQWLALFGRLRSLQHVRLHVGAQGDSVAAASTLINRTLMVLATSPVAQSLRSIRLAPSRFWSSYVSGVPPRVVQAIFSNCQSLTRLDLPAFDQRCWRDSSWIALRPLPELAHLSLLAPAPMGKLLVATPKLQELQTPPAFNLDLSAAPKSLGRLAIVTERPFGCWDATARVLAAIASAPAVTSLLLQNVIVDWAGIPIPFIFRTIQHLCVSFAYSHRVDEFWQCTRWPALVTLEITDCTELNSISHLPARIEHLTLRRVSKNVDLEGLYAREIGIGGPPASRAFRLPALTEVTLSVCTNKIARRRVSAYVRALAQARPSILVRMVPIKGEAAPPPLTPWA